MAKNDGNEKYAYLNRFSTEQLEELLRADIESPESGDTDVIFHILEVIERRAEEHPAGRLPDADEAWAEFQQYYNIPEGDGLSLYPCGREDEAAANSGSEPIPAVPTVEIRFPRHRLRWAFATAAVVAVLFGGMVVAQAAGIDVFGALGRWTDETFHFVASPAGTGQDAGGMASDPEDESYHAAIQSALADCGITEDLAPTWYPDGFVSDGPKVSSDEFSDVVRSTFVNTENLFFSIYITHYKSTADMTSRVFEKDDKSVEEYTGKDRTFYFLTNLENTTATWSDGNSLVMKFTGSISEDYIKTIIDSIGGASK